MTIVDSGIDVTHPDFLGRANTETLNPQEPAGVGGEHGTAVGSLVGAPANGVGIVGVYPEALLRSWDAARGAGHAARRRARSCRESSPRRTPGRASSTSASAPTTVSSRSSRRSTRRSQKGSLVVAASGNDGDAGNPLGYPASIPHVLTVGASDRSDTDRRHSRAGRASSTSPPPASDIPIATAIGQGVARRRRHELRGAARLRRERVGLDGAPRARRDAAVRGDAPLRRRHRRRRAATTQPASGSSTSLPRSRIRLRSARPVRAERRHRVRATRTASTTTPSRR